MKVMALSVLAALLFIPQAFARDYYVSAQGSDKGDGLALDSAWKSIARVNQASFSPGDRIFFRGGDTFSDTTLMPASSGDRKFPLLFSSYGKGLAQLSNPNAAVWLAPGTHDLRFTRLSFSSSYGASSAFASAGEGKGVSNIRIDHSLLSKTNGSAIVSPIHQDSNWLIDHNIIRDTGDSGIILLGSGFHITFNQIIHTGWNKEITWGKHGIYDKGPGSVVSHNIIRDFTGDGVSVRFGSTKVDSNSISKGPIGIGYFEYDPIHRASVQLLNNQISQTLDSGIYIDPGVGGDGTGLTHQSFVISGNTIVPFSGNGMDIRATDGDLKISHNLIKGGEPLMQVYRPSQTFSEDSNTFISNKAAFSFEGHWLASLSQWVKASGRGKNDILRPFPG